MTLAAHARVLILVFVALLMAGLVACTSGPQLKQSAPPSGEDTSSSFQPFTDIPVPAGARQDVERSLVLGSLDRWTGRLVLNVEQSARDAFALYHQQMPQFGWQPITTVQADISILTFTRGERVATIQIEGRRLGGATVAITMSPRQTGPSPAIKVVPLED